MKNQNFRSTEIKDLNGAKWRHYGNANSSVYQKKLGRSWATWLGGVPGEIQKAVVNLSSNDYVTCR
jgi:hypothetical protein